MPWEYFPVKKVYNQTEDGRKEDIYIQGPTKKIDMAFPLRLSGGGWEAHPVRSWCAARARACLCFVVCMCLLVWEIGYIFFHACVTFQHVRVRA